MVYFNTPQSDQALHFISIFSGLLKYILKNVMIIIRVHYLFGL